MALSKRLQQLSERAQEINHRLAREYPDAKCPLLHGNPWELLVATVLSAQSRDERVNQVTPELFRNFPTPQALANAPIGKVEKLVQTTGFFRVKARNIKELSRQIVERFAGEVPPEMDKLTTLPGVGRKTANVVLGNCFDTPGLTTDTHFQRVNQRLGLTKNKIPEKIEQDLAALLPNKEWTHYSHRIIFHGRAVCDARKPDCERCVVKDLCDFYAKLTRAAARQRVKSKL